MQVAQRDKKIAFDQRYLVSATTEMIEMNNKWQRQIKDEKKRRRNACMTTETKSDFTEQNDTDENQLVGAVDADTLSNFDTDDRLLNFNCIVPVTKITAPSETTQNDIAQKFTLNKNQKAAYNMWR